MKVDIPAQAPQSADFPSFLAWYYSTVLIPCPLYIITTVDEHGIPNAQPNSWGLPYGSGDVQMFLFSCWTTHHTYENALAMGEFVVNIPSIDVCQQVMRTVEHYPRGIDEIAASGLTALPSTQVKTPRIAECKAHLECTVLWHQAVPLSDSVGSAVIAGQVIAASADRDVLYGDAYRKLAAMRTPLLTNRSVDANDWAVTSPQMCGVITDMVDFWEMTRSDQEDSA